MKVFWLYLQIFGPKKPLQPASWAFEAMELLKLFLEKRKWRTSEKKLKEIQKVFPFSLKAHITESPHRSLQIISNKTVFSVKPTLFLNLNLFSIYYIFCLVISLPKKMAEHLTHKYCVELILGAEGNNWFFVKRWSIFLKIQPH